MVINRHTSKELEWTASAVIGNIHRWMDGHGLELATAKTEAIVLSARRAFCPPRLIGTDRTDRTAGEHAVTIKKTLRYLGVTLDPRRTSTAQIREASAMAGKVARLMLNLGGPSAAKRRLLATVAESRLLYAAPIWAQQTATYGANKKAVVRAQRLVALRVTRAYRTVSGEAALLLAGLIPCHLIPAERTAIFRCRGRVLTSDELEKRKAEARHATTEVWQTEWAATTGQAKWTRRVLPDASQWLARPADVVVTYHMAQALTCHGAFWAFLYKRRRAMDPGCPYCP